MKIVLSVALSLISSSFMLAQTKTEVSLAPGTTLPITFLHGVDSGHARAGAIVEAKTTQLVRLSNDRVLPSGSHVLGHVVASNGFSFDKTPYAKQTASTLTIQFDSLVSNGATIPLHVSLRAMADPLSVWDAQRPKATDLDPLSTTTQIGGDQVTPSQAEVESQQGDTVGYKRSSGVYAHLVSAVGRGTDGCDATNSEQSMGLFSASACGLYGYTGATLMNSGKSGDSTFTIASSHHSAQIWAKSQALLEVAGELSISSSKTFFSKGMPSTLFETGGIKMLQAGPALKVTVHINQDTGSTDGFLVDDLLKFLQEKGIAGATVFHAHAGFGAHHRLHSSDLGDVASLHMPVILYFVDEVSKVRSILPELLAMVTDGLVEAHPTEVLKDVGSPEKVLS